MDVHCLLLLLTSLAYPPTAKATEGMRATMTSHIAVIDGYHHHHYYSTIEHSAAVGVEDLTGEEG